MNISRLSQKLFASSRQLSSAVNSLKKSGYLIDSYKTTWSLERSNGSYIVDEETNTSYLDFHGGYGSNPIGWNHPKLKDRMIGENIKSVITNKPANADFYTHHLSEFVETFKRDVIPSDYNHVFFIDGGALAVENALKIAMDWKVQHTGCEDSTDILHFKNAFHGRSGYTMSLTNTDPHKIKYFPKFNWPRLEKVEDIEKVVDEWGAHKIAALIFEPIRCEGGDIHFTSTELQHLQRVCHENDILLIADEVQTGFFASGMPFAFQHYPGFKPDLVTFGKKSQQCGVFGGHRVNDIEQNCFVNSGRISSTWSGNLVDMVRSKHIINIVHEENLEENAYLMGERWSRKMGELIFLTSKISNVRNLGLLMAFDCPSKSDRDEMLSTLKRKHHLLGLSCGDRTIRFRPNLAVSPEDIDKCVEKTLKSVE